VTAIIPPDNRAPGQTGHIGDHNSISDVLAAMASILAAYPALSLGTANLAGGTVTIPSGIVTASSVIFHARQSPGGTLGQLSVSAIVPGTSFTITSTSGSETSQIGYLIASSAAAPIP
jgi:integral membrane sensor domain MASE1